MIQLTLVQIVTTHAYAVLEVLIMNVPLVMMVPIGMKENVKLSVQQDIGPTT